MAKINKITKNKLTPEQEKFCQCFVSPDAFFGNGVKSYIKAYGIDVSQKGQYDVAKSGAYENLTKPYINDRINELLEDQGLNDNNVDKQLGLVINQNAEFGSKVAAIREYNKLKKRVERDQADTVVKIVVVSPDKPKPDKPDPVGDTPF